MSRVKCYACNEKIPPDEIKSLNGYYLCNYCFKMLFSFLEIMRHALGVKTNATT